MLPIHPLSRSIFETTFPSNGASFAYCDGGIFDNEPLGMAKDMVDKIDAHDAENQRYYLFICPHGRKGDSLPSTTYRAGEATLEKAGLRIITAIMGNAAFQDWVRSEEVNDHIRLLDERAAELAEMINNCKVDLLPAEPVLKVLADSFEPDRNRQDDDLDLLQRQYKAECGLIGAHLSAQVPLYLKLMFVFQKAARLMEKDPMQIIDITADEKTELGGSGFHAFIGFCAEEIREHDFQVGRRKALDFIRQNNIGLDRTYVPAEGVPPLIEPVPDISKAPLEVRKQLYVRLKQRIQAAITSSELPWFIKPISGLIADALLDLASVKKVLKI
ncbi:MAG: hypothetical protein QM796_06425 [Chthoniobacteraceae bacterium]